MSIYEAKDPRFLELVYRFVVRGPKMGLRGMAARLGVGEEEMEAALAHLVDRGDLFYRKKRRSRKQ